MICLSAEHREPAPRVGDSVRFRTGHNENLLGVLNTSTARALGLALPPMDTATPATGRKHRFTDSGSTNIDRRTCRRVVPMEVLSLGMSRTGTASIKAALEILGYNDCYHGSSICANAQDVEMWMEAYAAKFEGRGTFGRAEWDKLLGHCVAVTDAPCNVFAAELIDAYPEAKIILVERDIESWDKSFGILIDGTFRLSRIAGFLDPFWAGRVVGSMRRWMADGFGARTPEEARKNARSRYRAHYAQVRSLAPKDRLLEYELGSGWEPLCKFLGKEVPNVPFPRTNEAVELREELERLRSACVVRAMRNVAGGLLVCVGLALASYYW
ncbi:hypothetical protein FB45DRAFT_949369 [Roridomyces roridus]|uniref:P-loop containing nucleoside triphosphate hydrolase protein n=1 Tax=Roridomyces roridus TaxID=1738132 RepID=A0AAD7B0J9_9AGAR|nr:hypothetical protein FB45DRAFT_949369 [Roridomyces roridus]